MADTLRIALDARPLLHPDSGIGRYTREITSRLLACPHELFLYSHAPVTPFFPGRYASRSGHLETASLSTAFAQLRYPRWARADAVNVFWSPRHHLPIASSVPAVVTIHDLVWRKAPESMMRMGRTVEQLLMPPSLRKAEAVIAVSESTRRDILELDSALQAKTCVIPEAAFVPAEAPRRDTYSSFLLFVGTFEPRKNLHRLLEAFASVRKQGINRKLVLAGHPGWGEGIEQQVTQPGLKESVEVVHPQSQRELETLYRDCSFLLMPSLYEGFGLPILEAMAYGKPVITSNRSSMPEVAGKAAILVDPEAVDDIASAIRRLATDRELYERLAGQAPVQAASFSWDRAADATLKVLEAVAERSRLPP